MGFTYGIQSLLSSPFAPSYVNKGPTADGFPTYGNYGGRGYTAGEINNPNPDYRVPAVNALDGLNPIIPKANAISAAAWNAASFGCPFV